MSSQIHPAQKQTFEPQARYAAPPKSSINSRKTVKVLASNGSSFTSGMQVSFHIPPNAWLDCNNSYLSYLIKSTSGELSSNSQCWINRLRVSTANSNQTIVDIQNYNVLHGIMEQITARDTYRNNVGDVLEGTGDVTIHADTIAADIVNTRRCSQLIGGIFDNSTFFPVKYCDGLNVDLWIESTPAVCGVEGGTAVTEVTISDISFVCEFVDFDNYYTASFENRFIGKDKSKPAGIPYSFDTFTSSRTTINGTSASKQITENVRSLKSLFAVQQQSGDVTTTFRQSRLSSVLYKLGASYYPAQAISATAGAAECMKELMKTLNVSGDVGYSIKCTPAQWSDVGDAADTKDNNKFVLAQNFELSNVAQSGKNLNSNPLSIQLTYGSDGSNAKNPATTAIELISFCHYDVVLTLRSTGVSIDY
jgi:hypothetical protein